MSSDAKKAGSMSLDLKPHTVSISATRDDAFTSYGGIVQTGIISAGGAVTLKSTLSVGGATVLSSTLSVAGPLVIASALSVGGPVTFASTLSVGGATVLSSTLSVNGVVVFQSFLSVGGSVFIASNLSIAGSLTANTTITNSDTVIADALVTVGFGSAASAWDKGMIMDGTTVRGFIYDRSALAGDGEFTTVQTNADAISTFGDITIVNYLPLHVGSEVIGGFGLPNPNQRKSDAYRHRCECPYGYERGHGRRPSCCRGSWQPGGQRQYRSDTEPSERARCNRTARRCHRFRSCCCCRFHRRSQPGP